MFSTRPTVIFPIYVWRRSVGAQRSQCVAASGAGIDPASNCISCGKFMVIAEVAVFSTVDRIRKVLSADDAKGIVSPVRYVHPFDSVPRPEYDALNKHFHRP